MENRNSNVIKNEALQPQVFNVRGKRVVLDREVAAYVGMQTKVLNQVIKRNQYLFDEEKAFHLTQDECLMSQIVTSNAGNRGGVRKPPYAFTAEGISVLERVLKREIKIEFVEEAEAPVSIQQNSLSVASNRFKELIYNIRGQEVMLDFDLAEIYGYTTKALNQQVKNNIEKFPPGYMFQLTKEEHESILRSKIFTSSWGGNRRLPYAFTELGVYRLMTILKSELALHQTEFLLMAFKSMKNFIYENPAMCSTCEFKQLLITQTAQNAKDIYDVKSQLSDKVDKERIGEFIEAFMREPKSEYHLMDGEFVKATKSYTDIYNSARNSKFIIDNYIDIRTLRLVAGVGFGIKIVVFSDNLGNHLSAAELSDFKRDFCNLDITFRCADGKFHDRYILIDYKQKTELMYHCGASSKDSGGKVQSIMRINDSDAFHNKIESLFLNGAMPIH